MKTNTDSDSRLLLSYAIQTEPSPLQVGPGADGPTTQTITIVVSNDKQIEGLSHKIYYSEIIFNFPVGPESDKLTETPENIVTDTDCSEDSFNNQSDGCNRWQIGRVSESGICYATLNGTIPCGETVIFTFSNIKVNDEQGEFEIEITEKSNLEGTDVEERRQDCLKLIKFPPGFYVRNFIARQGTSQYNPLAPMVKNKDTIRLYWEGAAKATYAIHDGNRLNKVCASKRVWPDDGIELNNTTTFTLIASIEGLKYYLTTTVIVANPEFKATNIAISNDEPTLVERRDERLYVENTTQSDVHAAYIINNSASNSTLRVQNKGEGRVGSFTNTNSESEKSALWVENKGKGRVGSFINTNSESENSALWVKNEGEGRAGTFTNNASEKATLWVKNEGEGRAGTFINNTSKKATLWVKNKNDGWAGSFFNNSIEKPTLRAENTGDGEVAYFISHGNKGVLHLKGSGETELSKNAVLTITDTPKFHQTNNPISIIADGAIKSEKGDIITNEGNISTIHGNITTRYGNLASPNIRMAIPNVGSNTHTSLRGKNSLSKIKDLRCYQSKSKGKLSFLVDDIEKHFNHNTESQSSDQSQDKDTSYYDINDMLVLAVSAIKELASHNEQLTKRIEILEQQKDNN